MAVDMQTTQSEAAPLTGEERLYRAFEEHVDPQRFIGDQCENCLLGQTGIALGMEPLSDSFEEDIAARFGVKFWSVWRIWRASEVLGTDYDGAMKMARRVLLGEA